MSVNWSVSKVANHEVVTTSPFDENKWHPVTDGIVWLSMVCGFREITEKNIDDVCNRVMSYQSVIGAYLSDPNRSIYITPADLKLHIGMTTNASTMTKAQWVKRLGEIACEHVRPHFKQEQSAWDICAENAAKAKAMKEAT